MGEAEPLAIVRFDKALHDRSAFSCGHGPIDNFLKSSLSDHVRAGMVVAYMATRPGESRVIGFYTLGAMAVRPDTGPAKWGRLRLPEIPVIYIRAIAVDRPLQGEGLGTALLVHALQTCLNLSERLGAAAVVLDILKDEHFDKRQSFYLRLGFRMLDDPDNPTRMFLPISDIRATLD